MKIIFLVNHFPPKVDGVSDYTLLLSKELVKQGCQVGVICSSSQDIVGHWQDHRQENITVFPIIPSWLPSHFWLIEEVVKTFKADWVICQYVPYGFNRKGLPFQLILLMSKINRICNTAVNFHEVCIHISADKLKYAPLSILQRLIAIALSSAAKISITSISLYQKYLLNSLKTIHRIPIGSNIENDKAISFAKDEIVATENLTITSFGLRNIKDFEVLLHLLCKRNYKWKMIVVGKVDTRIIERYQKFISSSDYGIFNERVIFTGIISLEEISTVLQQSRIFISLDEGGISTKSGTKAAAFQHGLPLIGYKGHLTDDFFQDEVNVDFAAKVDDFIPIIEKLFFNVDYYRYRRQQAYATYENHLKWSKIASEYLRLFNSGKN